MVIQLLVNVEAPDIHPGLNGELQQDIKTLAVDCLERVMQRNSEFPIRADVVALPTGTALNAPSEIVVQLIANKPLLTKADVCLQLRFTERTLERHVADGTFPKPMNIHGPRWRAEDIAAYEPEKNGQSYPHRD